LNTRKDSSFHYLLGIKLIFLRICIVNPTLIYQIDVSDVKKHLKPQEIQ